MKIEQSLDPLYPLLQEHVLFETQVPFIEPPQFPKASQEKAEHVVFPCQPESH